MLAETYSECCQTSKMKLFDKIISNIQPFIILEKLHLGCLTGIWISSGPLCLGSGFWKVNSFFQKFIHCWEMFIVECYIYVSYRATKYKWKLWVIFSYKVIPCTQWCYRAVMLATLLFIYATLFCFCYPNLTTMFTLLMCCLDFL